LSTEPIICNTYLFCFEGGGSLNLKFLQASHLLNPSLTTDELINVFV